MEHSNDQNPKTKKKKRKSKQRQKQQQYFVPSWLVGKVPKGGNALLFSMTRFNSKKGVKRKGTKPLQFWIRIHSSVVYSVLE